MRYLIPRVITTYFDNAPKPIPTYLLYLLRYPETSANVAFPAMITGTAGVSRIIPVVRAIQGVKSPINTPLTGLMYIDATYKIAFMPGPVIGCRKLSAWKAMARAAITAVLAIVRKSMFNLTTPSRPRLILQSANYVFPSPSADSRRVPSPLVSGTSPLSAWTWPALIAEAIMTHVPSRPVCLLLLALYCSLIHWDEVPTTILSVRSKTYFRLDCFIRCIVL